jgi:hypothetical protein
LDVKDLAVLEDLQVEVDFETRSFLFTHSRVPFDAVLHIEVRTKDSRGTIGPGKRDPAGTAWREILVDVVLATEDHVSDPRVLGLGTRGYATDGHVPELDPAPLKARARAVAEAVGRICGRKVVG